MRIIFNKKPALRILRATAKVVFPISCVDDSIIIDGKILSYK